MYPEDTSHTSSGQPSPSLWQPQEERMSGGGRESRCPGVGVGQGGMLGGAASEEPEGRSQQATFTIIDLKTFPL